MPGGNKMRSKHLIFKITAILMSVSLVLSACGEGASGGKAPLKSIGEGEGQVDIIAWAGYIERGETDPTYDWVTEFEEKTGCKVNVKVAATSDEMVTLMNQGGFDLVTASGDASNRLIAGDTVQEINIDLIPGVVDRATKRPWHTVMK
jgi:putative spermidine/putrescine transport system substrate-binding protein